MQTINNYIAMFKMAYFQLFLCRCQSAAAERNKKEIAQLSQTLYMCTCTMETEAPAKVFINLDGIIGAAVA